MQGTTQQVMQEVMPRVDSLMAKLGSAGTEVYGAYVQQAGLVWIEVLPLSAVALLLGLLARAVLKKAPEDDYWMVLGSMLAGLTAIVVVLTLGRATEAVQAALNPQYWAVQHLLADLGFRK